jgi:hypothetical protein
VSSGIGDTFFVESQPYRTVDGGRSDAPVIEGAIVPVGHSTYSGLLAGRLVDVQAELKWRSYLLDKCGELLWGFPKDGSWLVSLVGFDETLLVGNVDGGSKSAYLYSVTGERLKGPVVMPGMPTTLGADGTYYVTECSATTDSLSEMTIRAYSPDVAPLWSLELGRPCIYSPLVLADDGVLYVAREHTDGVEDGIEVLAIQTRSPGVAPTAWPTRQHDNRATFWLGP